MLKSIKSIYIKFFFLFNRIYVNQQDKIEYIIRLQLLKLQCINLENC